MIDCDYCVQPLDGTGCRWLCPRCGMKLNCCEGAPQPECKERPRGCGSRCRGACSCSATFSSPSEGD